MAQLHLYLPDKLAEEVRTRAAATNQSVSAYLAELVKSQIVDDWPDGYFDRVAGAWVGAPLERPDPLEVETRQELDVSAGHDRLHSGSQ